MANRNQYKALRLALTFAPVSITIEVVGWLLSGSLALLGDALHGFARLLALGSTFYIVAISNRRNRFTSLAPYRAEALAGIITHMSLLFVLLFIGMQMVEHLRGNFIPRSHIASLSAAAAVLCNLFTVYLVNRGRRKQGLRRTHRELTSLVVVSLGVLVSQVLILRFAWGWLDIAVAALVCVPIVSAMLNGFIQNAAELLELRSPAQDAGLVARAIRQRFMQIQNVRQAFVYKVGANQYAFSAELELAGMSLGEAEELLDRVEDFLEENFGVEQSNLRLTAYDRK
jgi:cobalt-zinc-cadmium efflux system protein